MSPSQPDQVRDSSGNAVAPGALGSFQVNIGSTTSLSPATGSGTGLQGEYFDNSDFTNLKLTRTDAAVNFNWGTSSPSIGIGSNTFSVRWTGQVQPLYTDRYIFYTATDDGVRLWVNGQMLIDRWVNQSAREYQASIDLVAGQKYDIKLEYYENTGNAVAKLSWSSPSQAKQIIPKSQLYIPSVSPPTPPPTGDLPGLIGQSAPTGNPSLPSGSDTFNPTFSGTPSTQAPIISEWTRSAQPGDTIVLSGWKFSNLTGNQFGTDTKFLVYGQTQAGNGVLTEATLQKLSGDAAAITLPTTLPKGSDYLVWAQNNSGASRPILINDSETWWIGPDTATPGQVTSVFGRNLAQDGENLNSNIYIEDSAGNNGSWAKVVSVNPYKIDFEVPKGLIKGSYKVWVHSGDGGQYGWSEPVTLTINDGINYTGPTINVKDFGAKGDGFTDDTQAIFNAITLASKSSMSTVYFPAGTYMLGKTIYGFSGFGKDNIRFQGAGKNLTVIKAATNFSGPWMYQVEGGNKLAFADMTLDRNNQELQYGLLRIRGSSDVQLSNLNINAHSSDFGGTSPVDVDGSNRVFIKDSDITGIQSFLGAASQVFIDRSNFYGSDYGGSLLQGFGTRMLSITNSTGKNLDTSDPNNRKWVRGRLWVDQAAWSNSQYQYLGNNRTIDLGVPDSTVAGVDQNSGEQILWEETGSGKPLGSVTSSSSSSVTFTAASGVDSSYLLTITTGKGIGQTRQVQSLNNQTITIAGNWNVQPDSTSVIVARRTPSKIVVYNNSLDGLSDYASRVTASTGVQPYFGSYDFIIDGNTFHELRSGISQWTGLTESGIAASNFTLIRNNKFEDLLNGLEITLDSYDDNNFGRPSPTQQTYYLGNSFRDNVINNVSLTMLN